MSSGALILMYHHIADALSDAGVLSVSPKHFEEHLQVIRSIASPISLAALSGSVARGEVPLRSIAITLDDGYADNLYSARPLLERYEVPATIFVTTGATDLGPEFWWDELERLLLLPGSLPREFQLVLGSEPMQCNLGASATYTAHEHVRLRRWKIWEDPPTERHALYQVLCPALKLMNHAAQQQVLRQLRVCAVSAVSSVQVHRRMEPSELSRVAEPGLIDIGAHTVTHPLLSTFEPDAQHEEIQGSVGYLESILDRRITTFSYPYGDYSRQTIDIARGAGIECACSVLTGSIVNATDLFELPRHNVFDIGGDEFHSWLRKLWLNTSEVDRM